MKRFLTFLFLSAFIVPQVLSNGVCIKNASDGVYLRLLSSEVDVLVNNQVAMLTATQVFLNDLNMQTNIKYAFPLFEDASATSLRWYVNGAWQTAIFSPTPQDTTLPGGGSPDPGLTEYLGDTPLFFNVPDEVMQDSIIIFELTYVQLLPYDFNEVEFQYPNDYTLIQAEILNFQKFHLILESDRTIENIELTSHDNANITNTGNVAEVIYEEFETEASVDYHLVYQLNADELGLYSFSTFLPDSANDCDDIGNGFMAFVVEPDPGDSLNVIPKVFTLIIDRSGSMAGDKFVQAKNAASFIVNNLNEGDYFNIVDFATTINSFANDHVAFSPSTQDDALGYIETLVPVGSTNISGVFSNAIADFSGNDTTLASIIIFFTDGKPNGGISSTSGIINHIQDEIDFWEVNDLMIHAFGIGDDVQVPLLTLIASQNYGVSEFLMDSELESVITNFYLRIQNPVLLKTEMTFDPDIIVETYPNPLTNLYLGQQLIVVGRYDESESINVIFEGETFGEPQSYSYDFSLADSLVDGNSFLVKIWAKKKIDHLYIDYFNYPPSSPEAEAIKEEMIEISLCYNVMSPFTSLSGGGGQTGIEFEELITEFDEELTTYSYPNPFIKQTEIRFTVEAQYYGSVDVSIYDLFGRKVNNYTLVVSGPGSYTVTWNGANAAGMDMPQGHYFYIVTYEGAKDKGRIVKY